MADILEALERKPGLVAGSGAAEREICAAEAALGCVFSDDYRKYLSSCGIACFDGRELTGIGKPERLGVVVVTEDARKSCGPVPDGWYVVERSEVDGALAWQDSGGAVYLKSPGREPVLACGCLAEWVVS